MEVGFLSAKAHELGESVSIERRKNIFSVCVCQDWSARDIQAGNISRSDPVSPKLCHQRFAFIVTRKPSRRFAQTLLSVPRRPAAARLFKLGTKSKVRRFRHKISKFICKRRRCAIENTEPFLLSRSNMKDLYWTIGQMLTHHASNGCNLQTGDLIATGTISGDSKDARGCLLELTWCGKEPIQLPNGEERRFLEDGDEVIMKGFCEKEGFRRIGFGECRGLILSQKGISHENRTKEHENIIAFFVFLCLSWLIPFCAKIKVMIFLLDKFKEEAAVFGFSDTRKHRLTQFGFVALQHPRGRKPAV